ncbi:hypothetical protein [Gracilimonas sediminicola]|uniref:hypothetical protein n=1 Tax=Gracilimonas sediminicola TaxID=2952158 RepID=UPI0038D3BD59
MNIEVIKPREITGKILTLIEESTDEVVLVSPYISISRWTKVKQALIRAKNKGTKIIVFLRQDQEKSIPEIEPYADAVYLVERLHAKLFINSNSAVFTSMNLTQGSDERSTDLGLFTTEPSLLNSLSEFVETYLEPVAEPIKESSEFEDSSFDSPKDDFLSTLGDALYNMAPKSSWTRAKTYWFSGNAAPKGDLMISDTFVWKLRKDSKDIDEDINWFTQIVQKYFGGQVSTSIKTDHKKFVYVEAFPKDDEDLILNMTELLKIIKVRN